MNTKKIKRKIKNTKKIKRKIKRNTKKYKGGMFDIGFIEKLKAIKQFIDSSKGTTDLEMVSNIERRFGELFHVKDARADYPTLSEHANNVQLVIELFEEKIKEPDFREKLMAYDLAGSFPQSGCIDNKIDWLMTFLIGNDTSITPSNKNSKTTEIIGKIMSDVCKMLSKINTRLEYDNIADYANIFTRVITNPDVGRAMKAGIISHAEIRQLFDASTSHLFEKNVLICDDVSPPEFRTIETIIKELPIPIIPKGSIIISRDGEDLGKVELDQHYKTFVNTTKGFIQLLPGMMIISNM